MIVEIIGVILEEEKKIMPMISIVCFNNTRQKNSYRFNVICNYTDLSVWFPLVLHPDT